MEICKKCYWCHFDDETIGSDEVTNICPFDEDGDHDEVYIEDEMVPFFIELTERGYETMTMYSGTIRSTETAMAMDHYVVTNDETGKYVPQPNQNLCIQISSVGGRKADEFFSENHLLELLPEEFMIDKNYSTNGSVFIRKKYVNYVCDDQAIIYKDLCKARIKLLEWIEKLPYVNSEEK